MIDYVRKVFRDGVVEGLWKVRVDLAKCGIKTCDEALSKIESKESPKFKKMSKYRKTFVKELEDLMLE